MVCVETGYISLNKYGEELCGDKVEIITGEDSVTMVLADGLGSGVKANILSTLTSKILCTMIADGMNIEEAVKTIAHTLPVCSERKIAYSTFTALNVKNDGSASLIQFDNPEAIYIHDAKCTGYPSKKLTVYGKEISESRFQLKEGDMIVLLSDGVVHAGVGVVYNLGWQYGNVCDFAQHVFNADTTAKGMAAQLAGACKQLYIERPGDDTTIAVARVRSREVLDLMIGPPKMPQDAGTMVKTFMGSGGKKVVCGGTTSQIVAGYLHEEVTTTADYIDRRVPPTGEIRGIELVTEGVLTITRALEIVKSYSLPHEQETDGLSAKDGATRLAKMLIETATDINFFVGTAINPAHQNPEFPSELALKPKLVKELAQSLQKLGKRVNIQYY